ncbi:hypothetical protein KR018_007816 [Drosophila ironensis]|nr:hypothetical protein KR018_007816 [Drosophila ironensis]
MSQIPPLNQKRILAFVNHFLVSTCAFLNEFALGCETKFVEMERQLQKTEASLILLEAKLASIPVDPYEEPQSPETRTQPTETRHEDEDDSDAPPSPSPSPPAGIRACEDLRYRKFFKMLQVGVPGPAIKLKMRSEGLEPQILE